MSKNLPFFQDVGRDPDVASKKNARRLGPLSFLAGWSRLEGGLAVVLGVLAVLLGGLWQYRRRIAQEEEEMAAAAQKAE